MAIIRRRTSGARAAAPAVGSMASRSGRPRATPLPRRNDRRERLFGVMEQPFVYLLVEEQPTLRHFVDQGPQPVVLLSAASHDLLHRSPVAGTYAGAGGIGQELFGQATGDLVFVHQEEPLQFRHILEALAVEHFARGV